MIREREVGRRFLGGVVLLGALVHLAAIGVESALIWNSGDQARASSVFLTLGSAPSLAAGFFGWRALLARGDGSARFAALGLFILIAAAMLAHVAVHPGSR